MLLDSTVAAVYDRRWSTKGRLVLDIHKCSAGVSPDMVSGGGRLPRAHKHTPRGVMQKKCGREPMAHSRTGEPVCTRPRRPCSHAFFISRRSGVSPDCENAIPTQAKRQRYISTHRSKSRLHTIPEFFNSKILFISLPTCSAHCPSQIWI